MRAKVINSLAALIIAAGGTLLAAPSRAQEQQNEIGKVCCSTASCTCCGSSAWCYADGSCGCA
ncbi:MAG TPA: hypothetical protein VF705_06915 [Longimicrobium sp.]|jgi:hypothetical protein